MIVLYDMPVKINNSDVPVICYSTLPGNAGTPRLRLEQTQVQAPERE
jgi:hypothetical protein